jgi:WXG100 family type VII secretion target
MTDHLNVDPVDLHMSAAHIDVHHTELKAAHTAADGAIEGAQAGWVGASAAALQAKVAQWQATTTQLCGDIASHGAAYRTAANAYTANDGNSAEALDRMI